MKACVDHFYSNHHNIYGVDSKSILRLKLTMMGMTGTHLKHKKVPIQTTSLTTGCLEMKQQQWANINCDEAWKDRIGSDISDSDQRAEPSLIKRKERASKQGKIVSNPWAMNNLDSLKVLPPWEVAGNDIEYPVSDIIPENLPYLKKRCVPTGPGNSKDQKMLNRSN